MPVLREVVAALERRYDPRLAEDWDAVGLVCGDPEAEVERVLFAVDPVQDVVTEAMDVDADLVVCHHPLFLRPVHGVAATTPKGRVLHDLVQADIALLTLHTNADSARPGASDALADAVGLLHTRPLLPRAAQELLKLVVFVPAEQAEAVLDALATAGAGRLGNYERCAWTTAGTGTFRPLPGAVPVIGQVDVVETVAETRLEMMVPDSARLDVLAALRATHPYEEPAFDLLPMAMADVPTGLGRVGDLAEPITLEELLTRVVLALPPTVGGVRATGSADALVQRVAVCSGAGDSLLEAARAAGADAFVTADLRHHPVSELSEHGAVETQTGTTTAMALVDVSHWASEHLWLQAAGESLLSDLSGSLEVFVSTRNTDPWTLHASADLDEGA